MMYLLFGLNLVIVAFMLSLSFLCLVQQIIYMGMWLSGRAFALHVKGPGFDPHNLQKCFFLCLCIIRQSISYLTLKVPRKNASENVVCWSHLLQIIA